MDIFYCEKKKILISGIVALAYCVLMVIFPEVTLNSARKGISLWFSDVLPALMPFFICANFLNNIGILRMLKSGVFPFAMSALSGYPMGAKIIGDLKRSGEIPLNEAKRLLSFCSTSGPAFMIGAVGAGMLGSGAAGGVIAASHYLGALLNGLLYTKVFGKEDTDVYVGSIIGKNSMQEIFTDSILSAFKSLGIVLAYIVLFMLATDLLQMCGIMNFIQSDELRALIKGIMEMTVGCGAVAEMSSQDCVRQCVMCTAIISWGGLSILGQTMSMLSGTGINTGYLIVSKLTHSIFSAVLALIIGTFVL